MHTPQMTDLLLAVETNDKVCSLGFLPIPRAIQPEQTLELHLNLPFSLAYPSNLQKGVMHYEETASVKL